MAQVFDVFSHHSLLEIVETDMFVMFFDPHLNLMPYLSIVHLPTLTGMMYMCGIFRARLWVKENRRVSLAGDPGS
jgi:hypothetical protein